jgi:hypothetical protein
MPRRVAEPASSRGLIDTSVVIELQDPNCSSPRIDHGCARVIQWFARHYRSRPVVAVLQDAYGHAAWSRRGSTLAEGPVEAYMVAGASSTRTLRVEEDGAFSATHLQPGRYTLWARAKTADGTEAAMVHVDVNSFDVDAVILTLAPTSRIRGRVVVEDVGHPPLASMQVAAVIADDDDRVDPLECDRTPIGSDGAFELSDIFGERVFYVIGAEPNWIIDRVMHGRNEVPAIKVQPGADVSDVVIVLRRR